MTAPGSKSWRGRDAATGARGNLHPPRFAARARAGVGKLCGPKVVSVHEAGIKKGLEILAFFRKVDWGIISGCRGGVISPVTGRGVPAVFVT